MDISLAIISGVRLQISLIGLVENCAVFMCSFTPSQYKYFQTNISKNMKCVIQSGFPNSSHIHMDGGLYTQHCLKLNNFQFLYIYFSITCFHIVCHSIFYHFWRQGYLKIYCKIILNHRGISSPPTVVERAWRSDISPLKPYIA